MMRNVPQASIDIEGKALLSAKKETDELWIRRYAHQPTKRSATVVRHRGPAIAVAPPASGDLVSINSTRMIFAGRDCLIKLGNRKCKGESPTQQNQKYGLFPYQEWDMIATQSNPSSCHIRKFTMRNVPHASIDKEGKALLTAKKETDELWIRRCSPTNEEECHRCQAPWSGRCSPSPSIWRSCHCQFHTYATCR